jgi:hypothetical protein
LLHLDARLECSVGKLKHCQQLITGGFDDAPRASLNRSLNPLQAAFNGTLRFATAKLRVQ